MERRRKLSALVATICFFVCVLQAHADQFNDLYYVDPGGVPDLSEEGKQNEQGGGAGGGESGSNGSGTSGGSGGNSSSSGSNGNGGSEGSISNGENEEQDPESDAGGEPEEDAIEALVSDGALSGGFGGLEDGILTGGGGVLVSGQRVRSFIRKDPDIAEVLRYWKIGKAKNRPNGKTVKDRLTPGEYYSLIAATLAADDELLEEARFTASNFEIVYRSRGALFAFLPWSFPVRVSVEAHGTAEVRVIFPWYHWFLREYFTREELALEIQDAITHMRNGAEAGEDIQGELIEAVVLLLRQKVRTITDSIILQ